MAMYVFCTYMLHYALDQAHVVFQPGYECHFHIHVALDRYVCPVMYIRVDTYSLLSTCWLSQYERQQRQWVFHQVACRWLERWWK